MRKTTCVSGCCSLSKLICVPLLLLSHLFSAVKENWRAKAIYAFHKKSAVTLEHDKIVWWRHAIKNQCCLNLFRRAKKHDIFIVNHPDFKNLFCFEEKVKKETQLNWAAKCFETLISKNFILFLSNFSKWKSLGSLGNFRSYSYWT